MSDFKSIKHWNEEDKPREKLIEKGSQSLTNAELLAILINTGTKNQSALDIAKQVMTLANNNILEMQQLQLEELKSVKGLGPKKAVTLLAAIEIGRRSRLAQATEKKAIHTSQMAFEMLLPYYADLSQEQCVVIFLNQANKVLNIKLIGKGGMTATIMDPRPIFKHALQIKNTTQIIISHNHPSGNLSPSPADIKLTKKLKDAGAVLDINVRDHIILGHNAYYSFMDEAIMPV
jgi:DNA repair protein RadC